MQNNVTTMPSEQSRQIQRTIEAVMQEIRNHPEKRLYLQVDSRKSGAASVKHIQFLTLGEFAGLCRVEAGTVYGWLKRSRKTGLKAYRPPGSRGLLFEMNEAMEWIQNHSHLEE